jgi:hypothetical protein
LGILGDQDEQFDNANARMEKYWGVSRAEWSLVAAWQASNELRMHNKDHAFDAIQARS